MDEYLGGSASGAASGALATGEATDGDTDGALVGVCEFTGDCDGKGSCGNCTAGVVGTTGFGTKSWVGFGVSSLGAGCSVSGSSAVASGSLAQLYGEFAYDCDDTFEFRLERRMSDCLTSWCTRLVTRSFLPAVSF